MKIGKSKDWKNWSNSVYCHDIDYREPSTLEELRSVVLECSEKQRKVRIIGAGHSFTPLAVTADVQLSIKRLQGIASLDTKKKLAVIWGGTDLKVLGELLFDKGYAMENLGDINAQTIAGAISTGTHGTGSGFGNIPSQIHAMTVMTAQGELLHISSDENQDWLEAAKVSLGLFGIIVQVELRVVPVYQLIAESYRLPLNSCLDQLEELKKKNRNFEFYWFPHTDVVQVKTMNLHPTKEITSGKRSNSFFKQVVVENGLFWLLSETSRIIPHTAKTMSSISALGVPVGKEMGWSHHMYATPRLVKFQEMEYCIPAQAVKKAMLAIRNIIDKQRFNVHFPIEVRYVKNDNIWLSPSYERESAYIAVHMYKGMDFQAYFSALEEVFHHYQGRPHWAKVHTMYAPELNHLYPKLGSFLDLRRKLDPEAIFVNRYTQQMLDIR